MGFMFVIDMFLSNNPSSGDINSSNWPFLQTFLIFSNAAISEFL